MSKRVEVKAGSNLGGIQNSGIKNIASQASATVSSHLTLTNENKGGEIFQEKTGNVAYYSYNSGHMWKMEAMFHVLTVTVWKFHWGKGIC